MIQQNTCSWILYGQIGAALMERFEGAYQMTYNLKKKNKKLQVIDKNMKKPTRKDLVFLDESPDYCERNQTYNNLIFPFFFHI